MRIQVRKCPFTGEIFEEKDIKKYIKHLKELRKKMKEDRAHERIRKSWKDWLSEQKKNITSIDQIPEWFLKNQRTIMDACNAIYFDDRFERRNKFVEKDKFTKLEWENYRYNDNTSNSHVCPEGGVMNWCAKEKDKPTGYPGFKGYLRGCLERPKDRDYSYPYSEALRLVGIKTGTGGGGNKNFGYEFTVFLDDWPGIKENVVFEKLKGTM